MAINKYLLITIFIFSSFFLFHAEDASAATYYASPSGGGNGSSQSSPFQIANFWPIAKPGDTLLLLDGAYTGNNSMITPPIGLNGVAGSPITIKALNDGKVLINGELTRVPIDLNYTDWYIIERINAYNSSASVARISNGSNIIFRRVIGWDANPNANAAVFAPNTNSANILFEDCAGWGTGRKIFGGISNSNITIRRGFFMWSGHSLTGGTWRVGLTHGYYTSNMIVENSIGTWDRVYGSPSGEDYAIFGGDGGGASGTVKSYGNIAFFLSSQTGPFATLFSGTNGNNTFLVKDIAVYSDSSKEGIDLCGNGTRVGDYLTSMTSGSTDYLCGDSATNKLTDPTVNDLGGDILQYHKTTRPSSGAWIKYRYVNGVLTNQPLWPWPMNERIKEAMVASGYDKLGGLDGKGGIDLTKTVFELGGGTCPPEACGGTSPPPPPPPSTCTSFTYSSWSSCQSNSTQTRTVTSSSPSGCAGGNPITTQSCTYTPPPTGTTPFSTSDSYLGDSSNWQPLTPGRWSISIDSGDTRYGINTTDYTGLSTSHVGEYSLIKDRTYKDFIFEAKVKSTENLTINGFADYAVIFNYQDPNNYHYILFNSDSSSNNFNKIISGQYQKIINTNSFIPDNNYHSVRLEKTGTNIKAYFDQTEILNTTDTTLSQGQIGIGSINDASLWDDITITNPSQPSTLRGDLNGDNIVNTLDWSIMNSKWNTADPQADLNNDGVVNTLDWSIMNMEWSL